MVDLALSTSLGRLIALRLFVFDTALKSAFRECCRIFSATREDLLGLQRSGPKVGVVTTSISRNISAFVLGNFNIAYNLGDENSNSHRLDVPLGNIPYTINAIEAIEDYRDLVLLRYRLITRKYYDPILVSRIVILALETLYPDRLSFVLDYGLIDSFGGLDSLYPSCGYYNRSITFLTHYLELALKSVRGLAASRRVWYRLFHNKAYSLRLVKITIDIPTNNLTRAIT
ncbi:uncharacterized protein N7500_001990 [Penicillium coprophilum]|uniref:uncharacterized protein n=1 Tax=Penicillium coprophilum TaxID=36646 RepID=UPI00239B06B2|nr:uncharacterized protein N7500_001990 [Penicillium coprophilum]KAJ5174059.1 hypothetical protein N7500_001990 [Penicillium coprophilum]